MKIDKQNKPPGNRNEQSSLVISVVGNEAIYQQTATTWQVLYGKKMLGAEMYSLKGLSLI